MARAGRAALSEAAAKPPLCRLYLLTPERIEASDFAERLAAALDGGDVAAVQLRLKGASDDAVMRAGEVLMPVCAAREVPFIVNDRPDLAAALGADGVHEDGSTIALWILPDSLASRVLTVPSPAIRQHCEGATLAHAHRY